MDRNLIGSRSQKPNFLSLSARRAWIEMYVGVMGAAIAPSLSARRAWIEIPITLDSGALPGGRSPQGERG